MSVAMSVLIEQTKVQTENRANAQTHPLVSVVIPAYNSASFISETIDSVLSQTFKDYELIVVNDGSPDTSELENVLASYAQKIVYLKQENRGPSAARNYGIKKAQGEFIAFLDSDDIWLPEFLEEQVKYFQTRPGCDFAYTDAYLFGDVPNNWEKFTDIMPSLADVTLENLLALRCNVITSSVVVRKQKLLDVGSFDETHGNRSEDFDLWLRLAKDGVGFAYQNKLLLRYRYRKDSLSYDKTKLYDGALKALEKQETAGGLSEKELAALSETKRTLTAYKYLICGKQHLANGEYADAEANFRAANEQSGNWKLNLVLFALRLSPRMTKKVYLMMQD